MLRMSVILFIGILIVNGEEGIQLKETVSKENTTNNDDSNIVVIKVNPELSASGRKSDSTDNLSDDNQKLIYVEVKTGTEDANTVIEPTTNDELKENFLNTRRFLFDKVIDKHSDELQDHSAETLIQDVKERNGNVNILATTSDINTKVNRELEDSDSHPDSKTSKEQLESKTRRNNNDNIEQNSNTSEDRDEKMENEDYQLKRESSEEDIEFLRSLKSENTRRNFLNDLYVVPEYLTYDDGIESAKSTLDSHNVFIDTKARSGNPYNNFDVPDYKYFYTDPFNKPDNFKTQDIHTVDLNQNIKPIVEYKNDPTSYQSYKVISNINNQHSETQNVNQNSILPVASYQPYDPKTIANYQQNIKTIDVHQQYIPKNPRPNNNVIQDIKLLNYRLEDPSCCGRKISTPDQYGPIIKRIPKDHRNIHNLPNIYSNPSIVHAVQIGPNAATIEKPDCNPLNRRCYLSSLDKVKAGIVNKGKAIIPVNPPFTSNKINKIDDYGTAIPPHAQPEVINANVQYPTNYHTKTVPFLNRNVIINSFAVQNPYPVVFRRSLISSRSSDGELISNDKERDVKDDADGNNYPFNSNNYPYEMPKANEYPRASVAYQLPKVVLQRRIFG